MIWSCVRSEDGHVLIRSPHFEVESQRKKGSRKRTWKNQFEEGSMKAGLRRAACQSGVLVLIRLPLS